MLKNNVGRKSNDSCTTAATSSGDIIAKPDDKVELNESNSTVYSFMVMPRLSFNLHQVFLAQQGQFSMRMVCDVALQVVDMLQIIHRSGYVFNDLKLDNLMVPQDVNLSALFKKSRTDKSDVLPDDFFETTKLTIVDFGFATKYLTKTQGAKSDPASEPAQTTQTTETQTPCSNHIEKKKLNTFRGNIIFSSANHLNFQTTSRRDDLISLFYLMVFMLKRGNMPGIDLAAGENLEDKVSQIK